MKNFLKIVAGTFIGSLIALFVGFFILLGIIGSMASFSGSAKPVVPKSAVLSLDFGTKITEQAIDDPFASLSPFGGGASKTQGILSFVQTIDKAATDPAIKFIYMNVTELNAGISHIEEIRASLTRFRESGKPVIAYADNFSQAGYYLATAADKIYINPGGMLPLTGLTVNVLFLKDLLDKAGIEVQLIRHGKFKAAAEQFISNRMSDENREQIKSYLDAVWGTWINEISVSRGIPVEKLNSFSDNLEISSTQTALEANLVDGIMYKDRLADTLAKLFGVDSEKDLKMISSTNYSKATHKINLKEKNKIAVIYADGEIVMGKSDENISSDSFIAHLSKVRKDSSIKAVVFRINSPGGSAQSSDIIDRELQLLREDKPVVVSMGDYAASGGYWIAAKADKILSNNSTLTGSIGVFSMSVSIQKGLNKHLYVNAESVNTNLHSDMMSGFRTLDTKEVAFIRSYVEKIYTDFIDVVAEGRDMDKESVDKIAQGRIWSGMDAIKLGLVDEKGGLTDAINSAAVISGLDTYRVVEFPVKKSAIDKLIDMISDGAAVSKVASDPVLLFQRAYSGLKRESGVKHMARLPFYLYF